jgi:hypothetical protein
MCGIQRARLHEWIANTSTPHNKSPSCEAPKTCRTYRTAQCLHGFHAALHTALHTAHTAQENKEEKLKVKSITLAGLKGAGKDSAAFSLSRHFGFNRLALADPIRDGLLAMLDLTLGELNDRAKKEALIEWLGCSPRHLMQILGTEWGCTYIASDLWRRMFNAWAGRYAA